MRCHSLGLSVIKGSADVTFSNEYFDWLVISGQLDGLKNWVVWLRLDLGKTLQDLDKILQNLFLKYIARSWQMRGLSLKGLTLTRSFQDLDLENYFMKDLAKILLEIFNILIRSWHLVKSYRILQLQGMLVRPLGVKLPSHPYFLARPNPPAAILIYPSQVRIVLAIRFHPSHRSFYPLINHSTVSLNYSPWRVDFLGVGELFRAI